MCLFPSFNYCVMGEKSCHGCFSGLGVQGPAITGSNSLAAQRCATQTGGSLPQSVCSGRMTLMSMTKVTCNAGRNRLVGVLKRVYQTMSYLPYIS